MYLYISPRTGIIGKILQQQTHPDMASAKSAAERATTRVEAAYPDWQRQKAPVPFGKQGGAMLSRLLKPPFALIVFYRETGDGFVSIVELEYESKSPERKAWRASLKP